MAIEFYKYKVGDVVEAFCCDRCMWSKKLITKSPNDSGSKGLLCDLCGHFGMGSFYQCKIGNWLILHPMTEGDIS